MVAGSCEIADVDVSCADPWMLNDIEIDVAGGSAVYFTVPGGEGINYCRTYALNAGTVAGAVIR